MMELPRALQSGQRVLNANLCITSLQRSESLAIQRTATLLALCCVCLVQIFLIKESRVRVCVLFAFARAECSVPLMHCFRANDWLSWKPPQRLAEQALSLAERSSMTLPQILKTRPGGGARAEPYPREAGCEGKQNVHSFWRSYKLMAYCYSNRDW